MARRVIIGFIMLLGAVMLVLSVTALFGAIKPGTLRIVTAAPAKAAPAVTSTGAGSSLATAVESDFDANEDMADSAPQQAVVAGWATKDALVGLLRQTDALSDQNADLSIQIADGTNALALRVDSVISLLAAIALAAIAGTLIIFGTAVGLLWSRPKALASASEDPSPVVSAA